MDPVIESRIANKPSFLTARQRERDQESIVLQN